MKTQNNNYRIVINLALLNVVFCKTICPDSLTTSNRKLCNRIKIVNTKIGDSKQENKCFK